MRLALPAAAATLGLTAALIAAPAAQAAPPKELTPAAIDDYLGQVMDTTGLPGAAVVVTHDDQIVHAAGYGDDGRGGELTADTPMRLASLAKSFTATAVMTLVEDGKIDLDEPVAEQLPEFGMADERAEQITVRQLLNQTSGLAEAADSVDIADLEESTSLKDLVARLSDDALATDPGTAYAYCNANYDIAARLVEVAGDRPFNDYLAEELFAPLGMENSANSDADVTVAGGHNSVLGVWLPRDERDGFVRHGGGSGSVITSAQDMGRWLISQNGEGTQLVSPESLDTMHSPSEVTDYGMGWGIDSSGSGPTQLGHTGNLFTTSAAQILVPETGYGFAVMSNGAPIVDDTYIIAAGLAALSSGEEPQGPGSDRKVTDLVLAVLSVMAVGLGVMGAVRSRRWANRRSGKPVWRIGLRLIPAALPVVVFAAYPDLGSMLVRGSVSWDQLTYFAASVTAMVFAAALAGAITIIFRLIRLRSVRSGA